MAFELKNPFDFATFINQEYDESANDKPIFSEEDVKSCQHPLMKLLKEIMYREKITLRQFIEKHDDYMGSIGASPRESNYKKNNILKVILHRDDITFKLFSYVVSKIFKYSLTYFSAGLIDSSGKVTDVKIKGTL